MTYIANLLAIIFISAFGTLLAQDVTGVVIDANSKQPIQFVNIGIAGKNKGTVSDVNGKFHLVIDSSFDSDSILFTMIGYNPRVIAVSELKSKANNKVEMHERNHEIEEVTIKPKNYKEKTLGVTSRSSIIEAGFKHNNLGYEYGVLMKVKKTAYIKQVQVNIANCTYDTVFFRLNIYEAQGKNKFINILNEPIYINLLKKDVKNEILIDLRSLNIVVEGVFLVTLEHVKDLGIGKLSFSTGFSNKTYYRMTSQGEWATSWIGIAISVLADVER